MLLLPQARPQQLPHGNQGPYVDANDQERHLRSVEEIAAEVHLSVREILPVYEDVLTYLKSHAQIQDYLPIFVSKKVKTLFQNAGKASSMH